MKRVVLPPDDLLRSLIERAYGPALGIASRLPDSSYRGPGRPPDHIRREQFEEVDRLREEGLSISEALTAVFVDVRFDRPRTATFSRFKRAYEEVRAEPMRYDFYAAILYGDIDDAIAALRSATEPVRRVIWNDITAKISSDDA